MRDNSSATVPVRTVLSRSSPAGLWLGFLGVTAFSLTVPFTKMAVTNLAPLFIGSGRAVVAAVLAGAALALTRQVLPCGTQWFRVAVVAAGVVIGFPLLTSFALTSTAASHGAVVIALLPAATAAAAVIRGRERQPAAFWLVSAVGALAVTAFASVQSGGLGVLHWADLLLLGSVVAAAVGYAEGGLLARELGSWQTISWALVLVSPLMLVLAAVSAAAAAAVGNSRTVGSIRVPRRGEHVPGFLRLVPRPGHRPHRPGKPDPARPARVDHLLGGAPAG
jgi:drug/metabolite transporter (DMT)-like permease